MEINDNNFVDNGASNEGADNGLGILDLKEHFVDTNSPKFKSKFVSDNEFEFKEPSDNDVSEDFDDEAEVEDDGNDSSDGFESTGNEALDAYVSWAKGKGLEVDISKYDTEKFNEQSMEYLVGKHYAYDKFLNRVDPKIMMLAENGVDVDTYLNYRQNLMQGANTDPVLLTKHHLYETIVENEMKLGGIPLDEKGQPVIDQEIQQQLMAQVEQRAKKMSPEQQVAYGKQIQDWYKAQIDELPQHLVERQQQMAAKEIEVHNQAVIDHVENYKAILSKTDDFVAKFSGQAEKEDFLDYMKDQISVKEIDGQQVVPLYYRLENDAEFLTKVVRLVHMLDKGYMTDIKNSERKATFEKLAVVPTIGKSKKSGNAAKDGFVDTVEFNKKFKR